MEMEREKWVLNGGVKWQHMGVGPTPNPLITDFGFGLISLFLSILFFPFLLGGINFILRCSTFSCRLGFYPLF